jgi:hypothetical protein
VALGRQVVLMLWQVVLVAAPHQSPMVKPQEVAKAVGQLHLQMDKPMGQEVALLLLILAELEVLLPLEMVMDRDPLLEIIRVLMEKALVLLLLEMVLQMVLERAMVKHQATIQMHQDQDKVPPQQAEIMVHPPPDQGREQVKLLVMTLMLLVKATVTPQ